MLDFVVNIVLDALAIAFFLALAMVVKPFWIIKKRWQAGLMCFAALFLTGAIVTYIPETRPVNISPAVWAERVAICNKAHGARGCPTSEAEVARLSKIQQAAAATH
jgi:hypothetical protein